MIGRTNAVSKPGVELSLVVSVTSGAAVTATKNGQTTSGSVNVVSGTTSYSLTLSFVSSTLNNNEWSVIKSVTKYTDNTANGGGSTASYVTATTDYFFLLSEFEVFGSISYGNTNEKNKQAQYAYYSAGNSKIKYKHNGTSTAAHWWLRSPYASNSTGFVGVRAGGTVGGGNAGYSLGFAPGFCV